MDQFQFSTMATSDSQSDSSPWRTRFIGVYSDYLPHWVVDCGRYSVTIRCAGKLPLPVQARLEEIRRTLNSIAPQSVAAEESRRTLFRILEKEMDQGQGFAPFRDVELGNEFFSWLTAYRAEGLSFSDFVIMPNHIHLITETLRVEETDQFRQIWSNFKGRSARWLNQRVGRSGALWQRFWYDRWIRNPEELSAWQRYLAENPRKAGLETDGKRYPLLRLSQ